MVIDKEKCNGCEACHAYCPVGAIRTVRDKGVPVSEVILEECVECGVCLRSGACPAEALVPQELRWPRSIRALFSDPKSTHVVTGVRGRGTNEMKTNDVTGRYRRGEAGILIEVGRPGLGTTLRDVETVCRALAGIGATFEPDNPVAVFMNDAGTGEMNPEILDERVLSAIVEITVALSRIKDVIPVLESASRRIRTVFSVSLIGRADEDGSIPILRLAEQLGLTPRPNAKFNLGLGRPLAEER